MLKDTATFQVLFLFIVSLFCAWDITTFNINSAIFVAFSYLKVKSAKRLCLLPVVLVMVFRIWSCLHHCILLIRGRDICDQKADYVIFTARRFA